MKRRLLYSLFVLSSGLSLAASASVITVTTTNNVSPGAGQISLLQALSSLHNGDEIRFNLPGPGPHYIPTPDGGYPVVTNSRVFINAYSQPGGSPNSNPILGTNNARLSVVLDSRAGGHTILFPNGAGSDDPGYSANEAAVLGFVGGTNVEVRGLSFLGTPKVGDNSDISLYFISFARGASGHVDGCWLGLDPDGQTLAPASDGVTGFRYQQKDGFGNVTNSVLTDNLVIGVSSDATIAPPQFNIFAGIPDIPIIVEGNNTRISGNFIGVLPDGLHDVDTALDPANAGLFEGAIEIGRAGNNTLIGTDGDGLNDENERNIFGGMVPASMGGYDQLIEFYGPNPGTNVVIAGNYFGIGVDGKTRFTNGVPILNASGASAEYRIGSNFDNLGDTTEANLIANNYPSSLFPATAFADRADALSFLSQVTTTTAVSLRGNSLIDNFPFPASPLRGGGTFLLDYYSQVLADPTAGVSPVLNTNSSATFLVGTVPLTDPTLYPATTVDVYIADPEGITNGMAAGIPELPQGFVQGLKYLGSFVENSAVDKDTQRGSFKFDISRWKLAPGTQLTVTANYSAPEGVTDTPVLQGITSSTNGISITWTGSATLQSAPSVLGPWTDESTLGNSYEAPATGDMQFFRLSGGASTGSAGPLPSLTSPFSNAVTLQP